MIRDVEVRYREEAVWTPRSPYKAELAAALFSFREGKVMFKKHYSKGTSTEAVWNDMRDNLSSYFIEIMYPGIVQRTITLRGPPKTGATTRYVTVTDPDGNQRWVTRHIRDRQSQLPDFYMWNRNGKIDKLVLSPQGYQALLDSRGGGLNVGIANRENKGFAKGRRGIAGLDALQEAKHGQTVTITVFIYPDNYDEEIRAAFDLIITFW
jgi:hypothetical protein